MRNRLPTSHHIRPFVIYKLVTKCPTDVNIHIHIP